MRLPLHRTHIFRSHSPSAPCPPISFSSTQNFPFILLAFLCLCQLFFILHFLLIHSSTTVSFPIRLSFFSFPALYTSSPSSPPPPVPSTLPVSLQLWAGHVTERPRLCSANPRQLRVQNTPIMLTAGHVHTGISSARAHMKKTTGACCSPAPLCRPSWTLMVKYVDWTTFGAVWL